MKTFNNISVGTLMVMMVLGIALPAYTSAATSPSLGDSATYGIISSTYTNSLNAGLETAITGDICHTGLIGGSDPISISGANVIPCADARGTDQSTALANINSQTGCTDLGININLVGPYTPGCYTSSGTMNIVTGVTVTLNGAGTYIFRSAGALTTEDNSAVVLGPGASACDVFWAPNGAVTIGANAATSLTPTFVGNILQNSGAAFDVTLGKFANLLGRILAFGRTVTTDSNTITVPTGCATAAVSYSGNYQPYVPPVVPLISLTKIPNPLNLPSGPGSVTYTYTATNIGIVPMSDVWVKDDKCNAVSFISGDSNSDSLLDMDEAWVYRCTKTVSLTETNTATAHGRANNSASVGEVWDTANAAVVVGLSLLPPLIHLVKVPDVFALPIGGGSVTYRYTVTNPGTAPLSNVSVIDDKCTGLPGRVVGHSGDLNKNNLLESNESWSFTCQTNIWQTTTNIGTAQGSANGLTAIDFAPATVAVIAPTFPNTSVGFDEKHTSWTLTWLAGILSASIIYFARKKKAKKAL